MRSEEALLWRGDRVRLRQRFPADLQFERIRLILRLRQQLRRSYRVSGKLVQPLMSSRKLSLIPALRCADSFFMWLTCQQNEYRNTLCRLCGFTYGGRHSILRPCWK